MLDSWGMGWGVLGACIRYMGIDWVIALVVVGYI